MRPTATRPHPRASWRALSREQKLAVLQHVRERQQRQVEVEIRRLGTLV
ncbi:hypothetical protein [Nocardioides abyssi]|uniref:Transposase n=1 Tax=Nocardioides abyssi TaxID=3058370 RepID=A0ABT8EPD8_9ACTN|nr:hypothetical protein [Nocardioides abyssi]MDN4160013.1 hypothetical protein [Nocardioides abyssi]